MKKHEDCVEIVDCLGKEIVQVRRYGGDIICEIFNLRCLAAEGMTREEIIEKLRPSYTILFRMKRNSKRNWEKIKEHLEAINDLLYPKT